MPWYGSGTLNISSNGQSATGTGTAFLGNVRVGDGLAVAGSSSLHEVTGVTSDTQLTFAPPFTGASGGGKAYRAVPVLGYDKDLSDAFNRLREQFGEQLTNLQPWATAASAQEALGELGASASGIAVLTGTPAQAREALGLDASIDGPRAVYTGGESVYTVRGIDGPWSVQVSAGSVTTGSSNIFFTAPSTGELVVMTVTDAEGRTVQATINVRPSLYIPTPTSTPANFGDPLEGGFYTGMIWNHIARSSDAKTLSTGVVEFAVDRAGPIVYPGQRLEIRSDANPYNKFIGTVSGAADGSITLNATGVEGSGTHSDWVVMSRFRVIQSPKAQGESPSTLQLKSTDTEMPAATRTLNEGWLSTQSMVAAGSADMYPAAHWARGLDINGFDDWYIPARDELELAWRNLKPTTDENYDPTGNRPLSSIDYTRDGAYTDVERGRGLNLNSSPQGPTYTANDPAQTTAANFAEGGAEAYLWGQYYWSSSEYSATNAWRQGWSASLPGSQGSSPKPGSRRVRAVRRSII